MRKRIKEELKKRGMRATFQRVIVLEKLYEGGHMTAEEVLERVREEVPSISPATVYNVLDALRDAGLIGEIFIERGRVHYDRNPEPHFHFRCDRCGGIFDVDIEIPFPSFGEVHGFSGFFYGICDKCRG